MAMGVLQQLVACRNEFVTAEAAGGVRVFPLDGPSIPAAPAISSETQSRDRQESDVRPRTMPGGRPAARVPTPSTSGVLPPAARSRDNDVPPPNCSTTALSLCAAQARIPAVGGCP